MAKKILVTKYLTYGNGEGEKELGSYLIEDTEEARREVLENIIYDDSYDSEEDFIKGVIDSFQYNSYVGDWDDADGGVIVIQTKEEAINDAKWKYARTLEYIESTFGGDDA